MDEDSSSIDHGVSSSRINTSAHEDVDAQKEAEAVKYGEVDSWTARITPPFRVALNKYPCDNARRGRCIVINQHHFNKRLTGQSDRVGTEVDAKAVEDLFTWLGFQVTRFNDLSIIDMYVNLREVSREDHSDADCFVCVILSHGGDGFVYGQDGIVNLSELVNMFKGDECKTLAGKPKMFFVQACRGNKYDHGTEIEDAVDANIGEQPVSVRRIPVEADVLIAYSVVPGYFSWRNSGNGSWFIQALVQVFRQHAYTMDVLHMLTLVNKVVAYDFESFTDKEFNSGMKQVPCIVSTLTKLFYFEEKAKCCYS